MKGSERLTMAWAEYCELIVDTKPMFSGAKPFVGGYLLVLLGEGQNHGFSGLNTLWSLRLSSSRFIHPFSIRLNYWLIYSHSSNYLLDSSILDHSIKHLFTISWGYNSCPCFQASLLGWLQTVLKLNSSPAASIIEIGSLYQCCKSSEFRFCVSGVSLQRVTQSGIETFVFTCTEST